MSSLSESAGWTDLNEKVHAIQKHANWSPDYGELILSTQCSFTEPVCPSAIIKYEYSNSVRYLAMGDTLEEAIRKTVDLAYREIVLGETISHNPPYTNSDDR